GPIVAIVLTELGPNATAAQYERARENMGLNLGLTERYFDWVGGAVTGDLGESLFPPQRYVTDMVAERLPVTLELAVLALVLALLIAVPLALYTSTRPGSFIDGIATGGAFASLSTPSFLAGLLVVQFFVFQLGLVRWTLGIVAVAGGLALAWTARRADERIRRLIWAFAIAAGGAALAILLPAFPRQGFARVSEAGVFENLRYLALPTLTLALMESAVFLRLLRGDLIDTLKQDYILAARAKGMSMPHVMLRHALRPSCVSLVTVVSVTLGRLIGGAVVIETIFNLPGIGRMLIEAIVNKDFPVVQAGVLVVAVVYVVMNIFVDLAYGVLDPRVRRGAS
ncbi:MAG TPA: ABC transporter permease, partial [Ilumatobacteraceae bacterium]|nr:ABC transporter permease [Ilumatobacteraceae bacterium]